MSLKEELAAANKAKLKTEQVTFLGKAVEVRGMTVGARGRVMDVGYTKGPKPSVVYGKLYPALLLETLFDPATGARVFADGDEVMINEFDPAEVDAVASVALRLSGMDADSVKVMAGNSAEANAD